MNIRRFVSGCSLLLALWLGATFFNEVPAQRYPKLDKQTSATKPPVMMTAEVFPASLPR